jgi:hypothetical protein
MWSFFFWLDLISLVNIPIDIYFIVGLFQDHDDFIGSTDDASNVARLGRSSKVGTKAGRYIKLIKLVKLVRVAKFFKQTNAIQNKHHQLQQQKIDAIKKQK